MALQSSGGASGQRMKPIRDESSAALEAWSPSRLSADDDLYVTGDRTGDRRVGLVGVGLLASLFVITALLAGGSAGRAPGRLAVPRPAFPAERGPVWLWLSATEVPPGAELVASLQNPSGVDTLFGVAATIDRWDGSAWQPHRSVAVCLDFWSC